MNYDEIEKMDSVVEKTESSYYDSEQEEAEIQKSEKTEERVLVKSERIEKAKEPKPMNMVFENPKIVSK